MHGLHTHKVAQFCVGACSIRTSSHSQLGKLTMKEQDIEKTTLADHELSNYDKNKDGERVSIGLGSDESSPPILAFCFILSSITPMTP